MKKIILTSLIFIAPTITHAHPTVWIKSNEVCREIYRDGFKTSAKKCYREFSQNLFDEKALNSCRELSLQGYAQSALKCLSIIKNRSYSHVKADQCYHLALIGYSQSALRCLK